MLKSMTGFGRATVEAEGMLWTIEVVSVNSRFLDVQIRLPRTLAGIEFALRRRVGETVGRGKVTVTVTWEPLPEAAATARVNRSLAEAYIKQLKELQSDFKLAGEVSVDTVAGLPDLFGGSLEGGDRAGLELQLLSGLGEALAALDAARRGEAERLAADIRERLEVMSTELAALEAEAESYARALAEKVQLRIQQLFGEVALDPQRVAQEAAFLAERADVTEERIRLAAHLDEFASVLEAGGQVGRRFNFLLQEMVRETNTIGSKTGELAVIKRVLRMKEELEKVREQVQNLE